MKLHFTIRYNNLSKEYQQEMKDSIIRDGSLRNELYDNIGKLGIINSDDVTPEEAEMYVQSCLDRAWTELEVSI